MCVCVCVCVWVCVCVCVCMYAIPLITPHMRAQTFPTQTRNAHIYI